MLTRNNKNQLPERAGRSPTDHLRENDLRQKHALPGIDSSAGIHKQGVGKAYPSRSMRARRRVVYCWSACWPLCSHPTTRARRQYSNITAASGTNVYNAFRMAQNCKHRKNKRWGVLCNSRTDNLSMSMVFSRVARNLCLSICLFCTLHTTCACLQHFLGLHVTCACLLVYFSQCKQLVHVYSIFWGLHVTCACLLVYFSPCTLVHIYSIYKGCTYLVHVFLLIFHSAHNLCMSTAFLRVARNLCSPICLFFTLHTTCACLEHFWGLHVTCARLFVYFSLCTQLVHVYSIFEGCT